ncbi:alpha/beta hydrolase [Nocardioides limicola]|uniref:alpha/beta hydrolase n=1 Tax=Nocardioides limicola TaxID=2803368 RepID=UPI00193C5192|nr:alpha/beta hydrolase [Nocardioides sp. DJM-14]
MNRTRRARILAFALSRSLRPYTDRSQAGGCDLRVLRAVTDVYGLLSLPIGVRTRLVRKGAVRGYWVRGKDAHRGRGMILYVHGGGFVFGSLRSHRDVVRRLSAASGLAAFFVDYRLAPEHPFPAAADDVLAAYRLLLHEGIDPGRIVLAGDSVGGALIGSLLHDVRRIGLPMPAAVHLMSPALDVTATRALPRDSARRDPMLSPQYGLRCAASYLAGESPTHPRIAVLDQDKRDWPPVLIQVGSTECMLGDAEALAASLADAGVEHHIEVWPGQVHVFQVFTFLPEARVAVARAGRFMREQVTPGDTAPDWSAKVS